MKQTTITRAALGRLPLYLRYLKSPDAVGETVSATSIARSLGLGEVQVRKDLAAVSGTGKPKIGYRTDELIAGIEAYLGCGDVNAAVIVGAGRLGRALLEYDGFSSYGLDIPAAFDIDPSLAGELPSGKLILPMSELREWCGAHRVRIGIITVPDHAAQGVCDELISCGIGAIWNFAPVALAVPDGTVLQQENLALSLAHLNLLIN